jgi:hypothetical protein
MKPAQENPIKKSGILYTIVHSTQFFEFLGSIVASAAKDKEIHSSPAEIQPITSDDVATAMAHVTLDTPANATIEIAGVPRCTAWHVVCQPPAENGDGVITQSPYIQTRLSAGRLRSFSPRCSNLFNYYLWGNYLS